MVLLHILTIPILLSAFNSSTAQNSLHTGKKIVVAKNGQRYLVTYSTDTQQDVIGETHLCCG